jgi:hypothetical protein
MRDIEEIEDDLKDAKKCFEDEAAEVCFHEMNRDSAKGEVDEYTKELEDAKLGLVT